MRACSIEQSCASNETVHMELLISCLLFLIKLVKFFHEANFEGSTAEEVGHDHVQHNKC